MSPANRDDFPPKTRQAIALRAGHRCSFPGCQQVTAGPSDESPEAVNMIGEAAHIHAAAPGGKRYLETMSREERADISNAIWLCATHARLVDRDEATFTADALRKMRSDHEARCTAEQRKAAATGATSSDLVAVGPDIIFVGEVQAIDAAGWSLYLRNFVEGDLGSLIKFIERFDRAAAFERYLLVSALGDGRVLADAPSIAKMGIGHIVRCRVLPGAARIRASDLPRDFAMSESHDLMLKGDNFATVSGLEALPQRVKSCLSLQQGESWFHPEAGTRLAEYYRLLRESPWFEQLFKLEVIRQAAIPYEDPATNRQYTPLQCVERVHGIEILGDAPTNNWLPIRVDLEIKGIGRWQHELSICIPVEPIRRPSLADLLAGPMQQ